jgi:hypothetical protein
MTGGGEGSWWHATIVSPAWWQNGYAKIIHLGGSAIRVVDVTCSLRSGFSTANLEADREARADFGASIRNERSE